jgi:hypothetical protein
MRKFLLPAVILRRRSRDLGASIAQLFTALPSGTPGLGYRFADARFNAAQRNGSTGFGASSGSLGLVLDQARGALDAIGGNSAINGGFDLDADWSKGAGWTISGGQAVATNVTGGVAISQTSLTPGRFYEATFTVNITSGTLSLNAGALGTGRAASGTYTEYLLAATSTLAVQMRGGTALNATVDNISVREIPGTHKHALSDAARPTLGGFAGGSTLAAQFNGTNSAMQTVAPLDMSSTDEVTVIAVVRSLAAFGWIIESSASVDVNAGTFAVRRDSSLQYRAFSRGNAAAINVPTGAFSAPDNAIVALHAKIATPALRIRRNSGAEVTNAASQGTGNYGNYVLNIGGRNGAASFTGDLAALCIVGRQPSSLPSGWLETMTGLLVPRDAVFS